MMIKTRMRNMMMMKTRIRKRKMTMETRMRKIVLIKTRMRKMMMMETYLISVSDENDTTGEDDDIEDHGSYLILKSEESNLKRQMATYLISTPVEWVSIVVTS